MFALRGMYCIADHGRTYRCVRVPPWGPELGEKLSERSRLCVRDSVEFNDILYIRKTHAVPLPSSAASSGLAPHNTLSLTFIGNVWGGQLVHDGFSSHAYEFNISFIERLKHCYFRCAGASLAWCLEEPDIKLAAGILTLVHLFCFCAVKHPEASWLLRVPLLNVRYWTLNVLTRKSRGRCWKMQRELCGEMKRMWGASGLTEIFYQDRFPGTFPQFINI